jgi:PilZ domain
MAEPAAAENREERRQRVLKGGTILTTVTNSEVRCTIRNMSRDGAELKVGAGSRVPQEFLLYVPVDGIAYRTVVRWRREDKLGVEFTGTEPKPRWHYG